MPAVRRRYVYPCADLVLMRPPFDCAVDDVLLKIGINGRRPRVGSQAPARTISVLGFPRSGNTYLESWVRWLAHPGTDVLDGRMTHSALDVYRLSRAGAAVLIPVRSPLPTCSSWLVRSNAHDSLDAARRTLRAYAAWYTTVSRIRDNGHIRIVSFGDFTADPRTATAWARISGLLRPADAFERDGFESSLMDELRHQPGQGQPLDGVPSHQMISLPSAERAPMLDGASRLLQDPRLSREREAAARAFTLLESRVDALDRTIGVS